MKVFIANSGAIILLIIYSSLSVYGVMADVCLQSGGQRIQALMIALPCIVGAVFLYCSYGFEINHRWFMNVLVSLILFPVFKAWAPLLLATTVQGHHLCGREFDPLIQSVLTLDRLLPLIYLLVSTIFLLLVFSVSFSRMRQGYVVGPFYIE